MKRIIRERTLRMSAMAGAIACSVGCGPAEDGSSGASQATGVTSVTGATGNTQGNTSVTGVTGESTGTDSDSGVPTGTSGPTTDEPTAGATSNDSSTPKLDLAMADFGAPPTGDGCTKVDFLFVLDNSISMGDEQQNLANSFPGFISTIQSQVQAQDYHIMVIDTDDQDKWGEKWDKCHNKCMTDDPGDNCLTVYFPDIICGMEPPAPEACDQTLGAGRNKGAGGPPIACPIDDGLRYMTQDQGDLPAAFDCVADMGATGNSNERPAQALLTALGPQTQAGGCHPGFLRDDAVLVVTMISDEQENGSPGTPQSWYSDLLALKGGNETAIVMLSLNGDAETAGQECIPTAKMTEFVGYFGDRGIIDSICAPDYSPFFQEAVGVIDYACDEFVPPG
ncbi:hypothetical protein OV203_08025 [Nannocystis sp. ILAH1]|uniref:hypothetical protein n=2 Tax=unclassified Nannocystis TaxID=2627009 RepID=UPI002271E5F0|nr:hypothetical protein [Nannocystis sp. ILAH1]MCY0987066.1 hypothetical protein [Nannocystis sp. ILAH1]